jgi:hypothetical protein
MFLQGLLRKRGKEDPYVRLKSIFYMAINAERIWKTREGDPPNEGAHLP